jgi:hypothetical protein
MQITFLNIYNFYESTPAQAQYELLGFWQQSIKNNQINFINKAKIEFIEYSLAEYPDQERLCKEINWKTSYHLDNKQFWQALGKCYDTFDVLYDDIAKSHYLMELTITLEEK